VGLLRLVAYRSGRSLSPIEAIRLLGELYYLLAQRPRRAKEDIVYFRNFSVKVVENIESYGCTEDLSYPVLGLVEKTQGALGGGKTPEIDNTFILISNDQFALKWIPASQVEHVDLT
jgi:hypothetical protein